MLFRSSTATNIPLKNLTKVGRLFLLTSSTIHFPARISLKYSATSALSMMISSQSVKKSVTAHSTLSQATSVQAQNTASPSHSSTHSALPQHQRLNFPTRMLKSTMQKATRFPFRLIQSLTAQRFLFSLQRMFPQ